jgi:hypothetical protein
MSLGTEKISHFRESEVVENAKRLLGPYEANVQPLLTDKGLQHGAPDPHGYIHDAKQTLRVLRSIVNNKLDPFHWPKDFHTPDDLRFVLLDKQERPVVRNLVRSDFANPHKFVEALDEFLTVGQIAGL